MSGTPRIVVVLAIEAAPRVEVEDSDGATWSRLGDWITAKRRELLRALLRLLREAREPTS